MSAGQITVNYGTDNNLSLQFTTTTNGVTSNVNITGWTVYFTVKKNLTDPDSSAIISKTITTHTNPTQGQSTVTLTATDTSQTVGTYWYDIKTVDTTNSKSDSGVGALVIGQVVRQA